MSKYKITGGIPLCGTVTVSGAKNAVLPILCASLICKSGKTVIQNCPEITDVTYTLEILEKFGCETEFKDGCVVIDAQNAKPYCLPESLTGRLRSTSLFIGAALGRFGQCSQYLPGGCELGPRPIDMHLAAFSKMGVETELEKGKITCKNRPHGTDIFLRYPSVGASENIIIAASLSKGTTTITNAAKEPEVCALCDFINSAGGRITGAGTDVIVIEGVEKLNPVTYNVIGDRIEAATFIAAALATCGQLTVKGVDPAHLDSVIDTIVSSGASVCKQKDEITVSRTCGLLFSPGRIVTMPYPGFPTDAQSLIMAMLLKSHGTTEIHETVFSDRLRVAKQFMRMGAKIELSDNTAYVTGVETLNGANLSACDLRSGAALVIAALGADGQSNLENISHIERGYQDFTRKLRSVGAEIIKTED